MLFLGCDGGSTKTAIAVSDENGKLLAYTISAGCNYAFLGDSGFSAHMKRCIAKTLQQADVQSSAITRAMFGLPVYGEVPGTEERIPCILQEALPGVPLRVANDAVAGWGGSLAARAGISVVAGTGSIAYGCDPKGNECRVGGWSLLFSDEGSCSWVGRQVITAFVQQADGRLPRTPLYNILRNRVGLAEKNQYFSKNLQIDYRQDSAKLASLQLVALEAAEAGDQTMEVIYTQAARELARMALTVRERLQFGTEPVQVSYAGGLFRAGDRVCVPFRKELEMAGCRLVLPKYTPIIGAVGLAAKQVLNQNQIDVLLESLQKQGL